MELGFDFILEHLRERFFVMRWSKCCDRRYGMPAIYRNGHAIESGRIYLFDCEEAAKRFEGADILSIVCGAEVEGKRVFERETHSEGKTCCIAVNLPSNEIGRLYECLVELFYEEDIYREAFMNLCFADADDALQGFLDAGASMLEGLLFYFPVDEWRGCVCASSIDRESVKWPGLFDESGSLYPEGADYKALKAVVESHDPVTVSILDKNASTVDVLGISVRDDSDWYRGLFLMPLETPHATCTQKWHISQLRDFYQLFLKSSLSDKEVLAPHDLLKLLLSAPLESLGEMKRRLKSYGFAFDANASYVCAVLDFSRQQVREKINLKQYCRIIEAMSPFCHAVDRGKDVLVVIDHAASAASSEAFFRKVVEYVKPIRVRVGISCPFADLLRLSSYAKQAEAALEIGAEENPSEQIIAFKDVAIRYILSHGTDDMPARMLCAPGVLELQKMSDGGGIDYISTLCSLVGNSCNISATAKELCICRSTLIYRIKRIEEITQMELSNAKDLLYLEVSLAMLKRF